MAHHEEELSEELKSMLYDALPRAEEIPEAIRRALHESVGATGRYPHGRLTEHDKGELQFAVGVYRERVVITFGKPIASLGMTADQACMFADLLTECAEQIKAP